MNKYLTWIFSVFLFGVFTACSTDDVDGEIPPPIGGSDLVEIPDAAFGEYMLFNEVTGVSSEIENGQVKFFLDPDEVITVNELSLSKTSSRISVLEDAGVATASQKITDVTGLEYFIGLQVLNLTSNDVSELDLTNLEGLEDLGLNFNLIGNLDVTQNPNLTSLRAAASAQAEENQKMSSIDLSNNTALRELRLSNHNFVSIDLSNNLQIDIELDMSGNPGPDGDPETGDIIVPAVIFNQLAPENRLGVISDADVVTTVFLSANPSSISEDNGTATITASLNQPSDSAVNIDLGFSGNATLDSDFTIGAQQLTIPAGDTEISTTITAIQDSNIEGDENLTISLANVTNAEAGENQDTNIIIEDDDFDVPLILNEILYDPPSGSDGDANNDGTREAQEDEFIELYNNSDSSLDVSGFQIFDTEALDTNTPRHIIPNGTIIPANSALVIFGGGNPTGSFGGSEVQTATGGILNLNNSGDVLTVQDANGAVVITFDIEPLSNNPDESYTRNPDITGDFVQHDQDIPEANGALFSPGTKLDGSSF